MLVEAQHHMFRSLKSYRPNNILINKAISTSSNPVEFIGHDPCGGVKDTMPHKHMQAWHKNAKTYQVETDRFDKLFDFHNINYVDFMVIDVEGGELDVLYTIDFSKVQSFTKELSFTELLDTYPRLLKGEFFGRAIVNPNK